MYEVETVVAAQNELGEGPVWDGEAGVLYWVDITSKAFFRLNPQTGEVSRFEVGYGVGSLCVNQAGGLVLATTGGIGLWSWETESLTFLKNIGYQPKTRFNDGAADRAGRFWAGTAGDDLTNHLYRLNTDGSMVVVEDSIGISNGIGWSPDNRVMYYSDSGKKDIVWRYDFELNSGTIRNRGVFLPSTGESWVADGLTVDSEGYVWVAYWNGWKVVRYTPDGQPERQIDMPVQRPTSVQFGGANLDELYITSARIDLSADELRSQPGAGDLFRVKVGIKGLPEAKAKIAISG